jgi:hypothetical protein
MRHARRGLVQRVGVEALVEPRDAGADSRWPIMNSIA